MKNENVPTILTSKDLDYLKDMFGWNYNLYKLTYSFIQNIEEKEIIDIINEVNNLTHDNMIEIINILGGMNNNE